MSAGNMGAASEEPADVTEAHRPFPWGTVLSWAVVAIVAAQAALAVATNRNFEWEVVGEWFFHPSILAGLEVTLGLTVVSMSLGIVLGVLLAVARLARNRLISGLAGLYIWFFRGTPLLVQLIFWYNLATLFPHIDLGLPFGPTLARFRTNDIITPLTAAVAGLALNEGAYMAEVVRGGLLSVDAGQWETVRAFGMGRARALWRVILPQAMRAIVPPTGNQLISMIKSTSLVSVIAMADLLYSAQAVYNRTFQVIPLLLVAVLWYLLITSLLNVFQSMIERHYARGEVDRAARAAPAAPEG